MDVSKAPIVSPDHLRKSLSDQINPMMLVSMQMRYSKAQWTWMTPAKLAVKIYNEQMQNPNNCQACEVLYMGDRKPGSMYLWEQGNK